MVSPGPAALCPGRVQHRRNIPRVHAFDHPVSMIWFDPDCPDELFERHRLWSTRWPAPIRHRPADYGTASSPPGSVAVLDELEAAIGWRPSGPVRMLTQPRRWGWLFNPFTLYLAWDRSRTEPVGAIVEVTNTPWKERHRYALALADFTGGSVARFDKTFHVSPFLDEDHIYELRISEENATLIVEIDVTTPEPGPTLETRLVVTRQDPTPASMTRFMVRNAFSTHRVSAGIHFQAVRLWVKRVPFVAHPRRVGATPTSAGRRGDG